MAVIPRYGTPQVAPDNIPGVRVSDAPAQSIREAGDAMARGIGAVATTFGHIAEQEQAKVNTAQLMAAQRKMSDLDASLLNDPEHGAFAKQGKDAIGVDKAVLPEWDRQASQITDSLPSALRTKFAGYVATRREQTQGQLMTHVMRQADRYYDEEAAATTKSHLDEAVRNYQDPKAVDTALDLAAQAADARLAAKGAGDAARKQAHADVLSSGYRTVVERIVGEDPVAADQRFQQVKPFLSGTDADAIEDKLRPLMQANEVDAIADTVVGGAPSTAVVPPPRGAPSPEIKSAIEAAAAKYGVPAHYLYALCEQESSFNPKAFNKSTGAAGLFQYIPGTAKDRGIDPTNVREACDAAAKDFAERMKHGGPQEAMASHFAGPGGGNRGAKTAQYVAEVTGRAMRWGGESAKAVSGPAPQTLGDALAQLKGDPRYSNPVWRKSAESAIAQKWSVKERDEADRDKGALESMRAKIDAAPAGMPLSKVLGGDYSTAVTKGWVGTLQTIVNAKAEGRTIQTNPIVFDKYARLLATNSGEFAKPQTIRDIMTHAGDLSTQDLQELRSKWETMQTPKGAKAGEEFATDQQILDNNTTLLGYNKLGKDQRQQKEAEFRMAYTHAKRAWIESNPGKAFGAEQADSLARLTRQNFARNPDAGTQARAAESLGLTANDLRLARQALIARGNPNPTDAQVRDAVVGYYNANMPKDQ
jgi:soluble lytic murein transglycosylase-like protein